MDTEQLNRLMGVVKDAADRFGGVYSRIWNGIHKSPFDESNMAFLSVYKDCLDAMDFVIAYEMPELFIQSPSRTSNARFR